MWKELLKNKEFLKITKVFLQKSEVLDIIVFGSIIRGKEKPNDIDILIIYSKTKKILELNYELRKKLENLKINGGLKFQVTGDEYSEIFRPEFLPRSAVLSEGFSIKQNKFLSQSFGYSNFIMFKYNLKNLDMSKRTLFYYALNGRRGEKGILEKNKAVKFSDSIILSNIESYETIKNFLEKWKIKYEEFSILIQEKLIKK